MEDAVRRGASGLERLGVRQGDVVCILLHNSPAFLEAQLAARLLGAYWCPINWHYKADEAGWILRDSGAKALITDARAARANRRRHPARTAGSGRLEPVRRGAGALERASRARPGTLMPYTSGTTGRAKGVRRFPQTPEQVAQLQQGVAQVLGIQPGMRALHPAPLYHSAPSSYGVQAALHGELLVLEERFDAERALAADRAPSPRPTLSGADHVRAAAAPARRGEAPLRPLLDALRRLDRLALPARGEASR